MLGNYFRPCFVISIFWKKSNNPGWNRRMRKETAQFRFGILNKIIFFLIIKKECYNINYKEYILINNYLLLLFIINNNYNY